MRLALLLLGLVAVARSPAAAQRQPEAPAGGRGVTTLRVVNDTFAGVDRWYSSRLELATTLRVAEGAGGDWQLALRAGQVLYTSRNIQRLEAPTRDHGFGAFLYGDLAAFHTRRRGLAVLRLRLGALGDRAFGDPVQDTLHRLLGVRRPRGWPNQIGTDVGVELTAGGGGFHPVPLRRWRLVVAGLGLGDAGNLRRRLRLGAGLAVLRGTTGRLALEALEPSLLTAQGPCRDARCGGFTAGSVLELRAYDRFVEADGAPVRPDIEARTAVAAFRLGAVFRWRRVRRCGGVARAGWSLAYSQVWRQRTFDNVPRQRLHPEWHQWGELEVRAHW